MEDVNAYRRVILLQIEATVDILCPWSYMQKKALDKAMARYRQQNAEVSFQVVWKPFYVNAELEGGIAKSSLYTSSMESRDYWDRLTLAGPKYGIYFNHNGRTGPSRDAHKLVHGALWELGPAGQSTVVDALFKGHFEEGRDVSDRAWLVQVGVAAGMRPEVCTAAVTSENLGCLVDDAVTAAMSDWKVRASPSLMVGSSVIREKRYRIGGFQAEPVFEDAFRRMHDAEAAVTLPHFCQLAASIAAS